MEIVILPDAAAVGRAAASVIADVVRRKPEGAIGLATGSSRLAMMKRAMWAVLTTA